MLRKTHLAIAFGIAVYFLHHVNDKVIFFSFVIISTFLPDIDTKMNFFKFWKRNPNNPGHRGFLHSYTFCILISIILAFFYPILALPFFIGYSFHLFADSFTVKGIRPFWPLKTVSKGSITTGGKTEQVVFWVFVLVDVFLVVFFFL